MVAKSFVSRNVQNVGKCILTSALNVTGNANNSVKSALNVTTGLKRNVNVLTVTKSASMIGAINFLKTSFGTFFFYHAIRRG
jgi:hypothetical protein